MTPNRTINTPNKKPTAIPSSAQKSRIPRPPERSSSVPKKQIELKKRNEQCVKPAGNHRRVESVNLLAASLSSWM